MSGFFTKPNNNQKNYTINLTMLNGGILKVSMGSTDICCVKVIFKKLTDFYDLGDRFL